MVFILTFVTVMLSFSPNHSDFGTPISRRFTLTDRRGAENDAIRVAGVVVVAVAVVVDIVEVGAVIRGAEPPVGRRVNNRRQR